MAVGFIQRALPHLDDLTRDGVKLKRNARGIHVDLPDGAFTVAAVYEDTGARYILDNRTFEIPCVALLTLLTAESKKGQDITVRYNKDDSYTFHDDGWMLIENADNNADAQERPKRVAAKKSHFTKYSKVTTGDDTDIAVYEKIGKGDCEEIQPGPNVKEALKHLHFLHPETATQSECSNSMWP